MSADNKHLVKSDSKDTIFALASGSGRAGVSIMRVSGPKALSVVKDLTRAKPKIRQTSLRILKDPVTGVSIDQALVLAFSGPSSFTGEDMAEFQVHGSPAVIESLANCFHRMGLRQAHAGEFTRRAFENGRMDLTEAEGLADLIDAQTEAQRKQAFRQMDGGLRDLYQNWRETIMDALAQVEGEIDFPDEEDVPDKLALTAGPGLKGLIEELNDALRESAQGEQIRHGLDIAIIGPPNAGKSTLINNLSKKEAAIVSNEAGTTRDIVEVSMVVAGLPVRLSDTAGLRETESFVEAEGIRRARKLAETANLRIGVIDGAELSALDEVYDLLQEGDFIIINKSDVLLEGGVFEPHVSRGTISHLNMSAQSLEDIDLLRGRLEAVVEARFGVREDAGLTRARHRACVTQCVEALSRSYTNLGFAPELAGEDLRAGLHAIKELAGETDIEAVLDRIFSRFCIGK